jgi:hypothetical protein
MVDRLSGQLVWCLVVVLLVIASHEVAASEIKSVRAHNAPTVDGIVSPSEWNFANTRKDLIEGGYLIVENDSNHLYLLVDLVKTVNLSSEEEEIERHGFLLDTALGILVDTNRDKKIALLDDVGYLFGVHPFCETKS